MGKVYEYDKVVRGAQLHEELKAAGFLVETVFSKYNYDDPSLSEPYCQVVLDDQELKDPTSIVEAHDCSEAEEPSLQPPPFNPPIFIAPETGIPERVAYIEFFLKGRFG